MSSNPKQVIKLVFIFTLILFIVNTPTSITHATGNDITIKGRVIVNQHGSSLPLLPVPNVKVEIWDDEIINYPIIGWGHLPWTNEKIHTTFTNADGEFSVTINNNDGSTVLGDEHGRDIFIKISASNSHFDVRNNPEWMPFSGIYEHTTGTRKDVENAATADFGDIKPTGDTRVAFETLAHLENAHEFMRDQTGINLDKTTIFYKDLFTPLESYCFPESLGDVSEILEPDQLPDWIWEILSHSPIFITPTLLNDLAGVHLKHYTDIGRYWEVVHHEYGHYVMDQIGDMYPPFTVLEHYSDVRYDPEHAFQEGWAHFFSSAVREEYSYEFPLIFGRQHIENGTLHYPDVEGAIAQVLWDFYDDTTEEGDEIDLTFNEIVSIITNYDPNMFSGWPISADHPWTIYDFFDGYRTTHANDPAVSATWEMLKDREIYIPDSQPPNNPDGYTSSHNSFYNVPGPTVTVHLSGAQDDISGVAGYYRLWDNVQDTEITANENYEYSTSTHMINPNLEDGTWYLHILTEDNAGNPAEDTYHAGPFRVGNQESIMFLGTIYNKLEGIYTNQETEVTILHDKLGSENKSYSGSGYKFEEELFTYQSPFQLDLQEGSHELKIYGLSDDDPEQVTTVPIIIDTTAPEITIVIGNPIYTVIPTYITRDTWITIEILETGSGLNSLSYKISSNGYNGEWANYMHPFQLSGLPDDEYTLEISAKDNIDNEKTESLTLLLDNHPPDQSITFEDPMREGVIDTVTKNTKIKIQSSDTGSGLLRTEYRISAEKYDSEWTPYNGQFSLPDDDMIYLIRFKSADNIENIIEESIEVINDNTGPIVSISAPTASAANQNKITHKIEANDVSGVSRVAMTIRDSTNPESPIGYEQIDLLFDPTESLWTHTIDTTKLPDGNYVYTFEAWDVLENLNSISVDYGESSSDTDQKLVLAAYHNWYTAAPIWKHWSGYNHTPDELSLNGYRNIASVHYPIIGPYDSKNTDVIDYHINNAKKNGIDSFAVDWMGSGNYIDESIELLLEVAEGYDFKIAIQYEARTNFDWASHETREDELQAVQKDLMYVLDKYGQHKAYLNFNNKPVVCVFGIRYLEPEEWNAIFKDLSNKGYDAIYIGDTSDTRYYSAFDGLYNAINPNNPLEEVNQHLETYCKFNTENFYGSCLWPGYDDTGVTAWDVSQIQVYSREAGQRYEDQWNTVLEYSPTFVMIMSYNNWNVGTEIEPSLEDGFTYLHYTSEYASRFTGKLNERDFTIPEVDLTYDIKESYRVGQDIVIELCFSWFNGEPFYGEIEINDIYIETSNGGLIRVPMSSENVGTDLISVGDIRLNGVDFGSDIDDFEIIWVVEKGADTEDSEEEEYVGDNTLTHEPENESKGIPGFPIWSLIVGLIIVTIRSKSTNMKRSRMRHPLT